jgi:hypothetical protein
MTPREHDGVAVGQPCRSGPRRLGTARVKRFAAAFAPQPCQLDEEAARARDWTHRRRHGFGGGSAGGVSRGMQGVGALGPTRQGGTDDA